MTTSSPNSKLSRYYKDTMKSLSSKRSLNFGSEMDTELQSASEVQLKSNKIIRKSSTLKSTRSLDNITRIGTQTTEQKRTLDATQLLADTRKEFGNSMLLMKRDPKNTSIFKHNGTQDYTINVDDLLELLNTIKLQNDPTWLASMKGKLTQLICSGFKDETILYHAAFSLANTHEQDF